jgi:hypothetical protein
LLYFIFLDKAGRAKKPPEADCQDVAEDEGSEDLGGVLVIWSAKKCVVGPRVAHDVVNPRTLELEVAKKILDELFDIRTHEVDEMIRQRMEERMYYGQKFDL